MRSVVSVSNTLICLLSFFPRNSLWSGKWTHTMILPDAQRIRPCQMLLEFLGEFLEVIFLEVCLNIFWTVPVLMHSEFVLWYEWLESMLPMVASNCDREDSPFSISWTGSYNFCRWPSLLWVSFFRDSSIALTVLADPGFRKSQKNAITGFQKKRAYLAFNMSNHYNGRHLYYCFALKIECTQLE